MSSLPHFRDINPSAPDMTDVRAAYQRFHKALADATDTAARIAAVREWDTLRKEINTWRAVTNLHFSQDTRNADYKAARKQADELGPQLAELETDFKRTLVETHSEGLEDELGSYVMELWRNDLQTFDPAIADEMVRESELKMAYTELISSAAIEFRGETHNLSGLAKFATDADRDTRHEAARLSWGFMGEHAGELDRIYDELVATRTTIANKLGDETFTPLGYRRMSRTDYDRSHVEAFRNEVRDHVVPLVTELRGAQAKRLGVDKLMAWDEILHEPAGNPVPLGDTASQTEAAHRMFAALSPTLAEFFRVMTDHGLLDLDVREGKAGGGFCTMFAKYGLPFIFANFNGTAADVRVFTHECGHAFQGYSSCGNFPNDLVWPTSEAAEIHSMSLEFLCGPQMELFFGDDAGRFRQQHLTGALTFIPYGVAIDDFQHRVYDNPGASPADRLQMWREVEAEWLPWRDWGDLERPAAGAVWQRQLHVYQYPFYYIDYTLAQTCALQFWLRSRENAPAAMADYITLCKRGGDAPFRQLAESAGLKSPFESGVLRDVAATARQALEV